MQNTATTETGTQPIDENEAIEFIQSLPVDKRTDVEINADFFAAAALWEQREITLEALRKQAWKTK